MNSFESSLQALMPHGYCLQWFPALLWTHVLSDVVIAAAYFSIPAGILYVLMRQQQRHSIIRQFSTLAILFAGFIVLCGATHLAEIATIWTPIYPQEGALKALTAAVSAVTAVVLLRSMPELLALRTGAEFDAESSQRRQAEAAERRTQQAYAELEQAMQKMRLMQAHLSDTETMAILGKSVAGIAHEVNTPLATALAAAASVRMDLDDLAEQPSDAGQHRTLVESAQASARDIELAVQRAATLIRSYKTVAVDQTSLRSRHVELKRFLTDNIRSMTPRSGGHHHAIRVECPDGLAARLPAGVLSQVLAILLENAIHHAFPDGRTGEIRIGAQMVGEALEISVRDNGVGIDPTTQERVFEPFFTTCADRGGSGIGLDLARQLVTRRLEGTLELHSTPGQGCCFTLRFPLAQHG